MTIKLIQKSKPFGLCSFFCPAVFSLVLVSAPLAAKTLIFESSQQGGEQTGGLQQSEQVIKPRAGKTISTTDLGGAAPAKAQTSANSATSNAVSQMYFMLETLKREVSELRAVVEEQSYRLQGFEEASKRRYKDIDARIQGLSATKPAVPASTSSSDASSAVTPAIVPAAAKPVVEVTAEQKQAYAKAYSLVKEKRFDDAVDALHAYIERYPDGELSGNAYYWLGEVYLVLPQLEQAKQSFLIVLNSFPEHRKLADSIFKLAVTYDRLQDPVNSEKYLKLVQSRFPNSTAAKLANSYKIAR